MDKKNAEQAANYRYLLREVETDLDADGKAKSQIIRTFDVTQVEGSPYRRMVGRNDGPLTDTEQRFEDNKLQFNIEQRKKETPDQRQARIASWKKREERRREPLRELPDAFDFKIAREEANQWVIHATPRPGYKPKSQATSFFPKVSLRLWVDKREFQCVRAEMEVKDTVSFGGFLVRVAKGGKLVLENARVNGDVWLPKAFSMEASARMMLVKGYHKRMDYAFSDYKKSQGDPPVVAAAPAIP